VWSTYRRARAVPLQSVCSHHKLAPYVTLFVACAVTSGEARVAEPDKATKLAWLTPAELRGRDDLFAPLRRRR
jgi:hypothetical protein